MLKPRLAILEKEQEVKQPPVWQPPKKRGRKPRKFDWPVLLQGRAWTAHGVAEILQMELPATRRHLRRATNLGVLIMRKHGRIKYYAVRQAVTLFVTRAVR